MARKRHERGFATATVLLLTLILTSTSILLLQAAVSERQRSVIEVENAQTLASLESALLWAATELASAPEKRIAFVDSAVETYIYADAEIEVELVQEGEKLDLNTASLDVLETALLGLLETGETPSVLEIVQNRASEPVKLVDDLWQNADMTAVDRACLRKHFTVFGGQTEAIGAVEPTPFNRFVSAGRNFQIRATSRRETDADQSILVIILMTGIPEDPYWVLDWRFIASPTSERCERDVQT